MEKILRSHQPFSLVEILKGLIESSDILLHKKDYDGHGWEELELCYRYAKEVLCELESKPHGWVDTKMMLPRIEPLGSIDVWACCGNSAYAASYITDENNTGRFYIDMKFPKSIFFDITDGVTHWMYLELPKHTA